MAAATMAIVSFGRAFNGSGTATVAATSTWALLAPADSRKAATRPPTAIDGAMKELGARFMGPPDAMVSDSTLQTRALFRRADDRFTPSKSSAVQRESDRIQ